jgi:hypothetical protein
LFFSLLCSPAVADNLAGQASIIDGDTLEIHGARIRLWGIDALIDGIYLDCRMLTIQLTTKVV